MSKIKLLELQGEQIDPWLDDLGRIRIEVFREFPYLYDGDLNYERRYLGRYRDAANALVVAAINSTGEMVGATTCLPMSEEESEFRQPLVDAGLDVDGIFYLGESVLLPAWRGRGIGKMFFDRREAHARRLGYHTTCFCAVERAVDHPARPEDYRPLDGFWQSRGYRKHPGLQARFPWKELGAEEESEQVLTYWIREDITP